MLTERQLEIVLAVVYEYIQTGEAVGSRTLSRKFLRSHSAATIRNEMADLEEMGYFTQPHSSAGRLPTSRAFRVYVDSILHRPSSPKPGVQAKVQQMRQQLQGLESRLAEISRFLGRLTQCLGLAAVRVIDQLKFQKVDFVKTSASTMVLILVLEGGVVQHRHLAVRSELSQEDLDELAGEINRLGSGKAWQEVREPLYRYLAQRLAHWDRYRPTVEQVDTLMLRQSPALASSTGGFRELMGAAGLEDLGRFQAICSLLDEDQGLEDLIQHYSVEDGFKVTIGSENALPAMQNCSVMMASASTGGRQAVVGLIGPMRMNYEHSIAVLEAALRGLHRPADEEEVS